MPSDKVELPGLFAERKGGKKRTQWQDRDLASAVVTRYLTDPDTGEVMGEDTDAYEAARDVTDLILRLAGVSYWRVTALRDYGINADDYCTSERGRRTVVIREADPTEPQSEPLRVVA
jgi:hypothetical protein